MNALPISHPPMAGKMPAMLDYAKPQALFARRRGWDIPVLVLAIPALAAPFVDFIFSYSPSSVIIQYFRDWREIGDYGIGSWPWLILVAAPFYLGIAFWVCRLRMLIRPDITLFERRLLWVLALASACATVGFIASAVAQGSYSPEMLLCLVPTSLLAAGALSLRRFSRSRGIDPGRRACLAVASAYVGGVSLPLILLRDSTEIGWKLTFAAAIVMMADFALHMLLPQRRG
jgi:hypothetical protein